jgi:hypothetical protein
MANLSQETQAIIDRLKAEGDLVRNSGTNSIRSVKFQLDKFEGIFDTISTNIAEQTDILRLQAGIAQEQIERDRNKEQFEEVTPKEQYDDQQENKSNKLVTDNENAKINKIGDSISSALSLKNIMLASAGIFVGYNFIKGYINESTGGGFDRMIEGIKNTDFAAMGTTITAMTTGLGNINWTNFSTAVNNASTMITNFSKWLGETGVGDIVGMVVGGGLVTAGAKGAVMGALAKGGGKGAGFAGRLAGIGPGIALAAAGLAIAYGDEIGAYIDSQLGTTPDASGGGGTGQDIVNVLSGAATIAGIFGFGSPAGIAALAIGGTIALGLIIKDKVEQFKNAESEKFDSEVDAALKLAEERGIDNMSEEERANFGQTYSEALRRQRLALNNAMIENAEQAQAEMEEIMANESLGDGTEGVNRLQLDRIREDAASGDQAAIEELFRWAEGRESETSGSFFRWMSGKSDKDAFIRDIIQSLGPDIGNYENNPGGIDSYNSAVDEWERRSQEILNERGYRKGTGGFKDFGSGTTAILHGAEAVVPLNSPEGQILKNLFNGNTPADVVSNAGSSYGTSAPVIINAPVNTSSPTILNQAGSTVSQISYSGGSGSAMGPSLLPYGITGSIA